jgi:hypothetical protein
VMIGQRLGAKLPKRSPFQRDGFLVVAGSKEKSSTA